MTAHPTSTQNEPDQRTRWWPFWAVCIGYLATTTSESLLAPIYPLVAPDLGLEVADAGTSFALLAFSIAVANLVGGVSLRRFRSNQVLAGALAFAAAGSAVAGMASSNLAFLTGQVLIGTGAGFLYPAAIMSIGHFAGPGRRGFAMGVFGVFFSGGLTLAAALAALGSAFDWRLSFVVGVLLATVALGGVATLRDCPKSDTTGAMFAGLRSVLGVPSLVGVVGGVSQYATVSFLPLFAVEIWGWSDASAAVVLAVGRVLSVPSKLVAGALADRSGPERSAAWTAAALVAAGLAWTLVPVEPVSVAGAVVFAAGVSALFPLANLLALERVGRSGGALGAFRSLQLAAGAGAGLALGASAHAFGLHATVALATVVPALIVIGLPRRR